MKSCVLTTVLLALFFITLCEALTNSSQLSPSPRNSRQCNDCQCGIKKDSRIFGGSHDDRRNHPWLVQIRYFGGHQCGASLITRRHVLTAAHCLKNIETSFLTVQLADSSIHGVSSYIKHRQFNVSHPYDSDIAIIILSEPVTLSRAVTTICLPEQGDGNYGTSGYVSGWGKKFEGDKSLTELRTVEVPILKHEDCREKSYLHPSSFSLNQFCAGFIERGGPDSCQGDSGGPLVFRNRASTVLAGIVSWGIGCGLKGYPGIYTKVSEFKYWIDAIVLSSGECLCPSIYG